MRLDVLLVERGMVESRALAQRLIMAGQVRVNGQVALKPAVSVVADAPIDIEHGPPYVSRGGEKLAAALLAFPIVVAGKVCADVGASTGGFSDCLLQAGAQKIYAIDVGKGVLHWKLRQDQRMVVMENTNARFVETLPEPVELSVIDVSFISLKVLLPVVAGWYAGSGDLVALIKPQFEAGRAEVAHGDGVIRDPNIHRSVLQDVLRHAGSVGYTARGLIRSPLLGPKGNVEFLVWLEWGEKSAPPTNAAALHEWIDAALEGA